MPETALPVDVEALTAAYLRSVPEVAAIAGDRIGTRIPDDPEWPRIRLTRNGGGPVFQFPLFLDAARIQVEAWGDFTADGKAVTWELIAEAQRALHSMDGSYPVFAGIVTGVDTELGPIWEPDPENGRPRYLLAVRVYATPTVS